jgi:hypothetical protein
MTGAPEFLAAEVEKLLWEEGDERGVTPKDAEALERAIALARGAVVRRALRNCLVTVRTLRLTADMFNSVSLGAGEEMLKDGQWIGMGELGKEEKV